MVRIFLIIVVDFNNKSSKLIMKFSKNNFLVSLFSSLFIFLYFPLKVLANPSTLEGLEKTGDAVPGINNGDLPTMIGVIVGALLSFVGVLFLILMIYGGVMWMTARGNEQQVEKARSLIIAAIIGIIIVLAAYAITMFIGSIVTG